MHNGSILSSILYISVLYLLIKGIKSDVLGVISAKINWNTEKASRMVIPRDTLSPESQGSQNKKMVIRTNMKQGPMMLSRK